MGSVTQLFQTLLDRGYVQSQLTAQFLQLALTAVEIEFPSVG
jgi:hypothetical protein